MRYRIEGFFALKNYRVFVRAKIKSPIEIMRLGFYIEQVSESLLVFTVTKPLE